MRQTAAVGVIKKDVLLPKPDHMIVPAQHGSMFGSPDLRNVKPPRFVGAATASHTATILGLPQFYGTSTSTAACTTPVSFQADARFSQLFNGADPESRASARLEVGSTSAFSFNPPATPTPFVSVPGTPVFIFGATEAASAPLDPLPLHDHQQHFRQSSIDELYEADLHARTALLAARLARTLDPAAMSWQGHRLSYTAAPPLSPPTSLPLRDFSHLTYTFQMFQRNAGRTELTGPADDLAEFKELVSLGFQPFIRGYASYAFAFYATYHEACRWARENGHRSRPVFWQAGSPSGPFKLMCDHDIKVLRDRIRATSEVGPIKSQLHTRGYDIPAVRCIQRVVRRHLAKAKRDITEDDLDQLIARAAVCIQRTVRRHLSARANLSRRFRASDTVPSVPDPAVELPDTASSKVPSGDPEQWAPEDSDDAASAASTTWDISSLLLGLLYGPWSTRRRRTSRRTGSLYRHIQTAPTCSLEQLVSSDTASLPWPRSRLNRHTYRLSNISHRRPRLSINHGCTDGTGPRPSFEPK